MQANMNPDSTAERFSSPFARARAPSVLRRNQAQNSSEKAHEVLLETLSPFIEEQQKAIAALTARVETMSSAQNAENELLKERVSCLGREIQSLRLELEQVKNKADSAQQTADSAFSRANEHVHTIPIFYHCESHSVHITQKPQCNTANLWTGKSWK